MQVERIQRWLNATEANTEQLSPAMPPVNDEPATNDRAVKRCRLNPAIIRPPSCNTRPKSPGDMVSPTLSGNLSKRPFDDETPCIRRVQTSTSERSYSSDHSASSSRRAGRTASLQKQLRLLQLNPRGLDVRDMYDVKYTKARPQTLQTLLGDIDAFSDGHGIVAKDAQHALEKAAGSDSRFSWALRPGALHVSHEKDLAGRTPPPGAVRKVMNAAAECSTKQHPEANWNLEVHQQILDMAFRPTEESEFVNLIDFMGSTTASIIPEYGISTLSKKADFCVYIEPENDPSLSPTFRAGASYARPAMPQGVLNFTDFAALYSRFIALSIKV